MVLSRVKTGHTIAREWNSGYRILWDGLPDTERKGMPCFMN